MIKVGAIILAAGKSTRMGQNKLLMPIDGRPMLLQVVDCCAEAGFDLPIVCIGHDRERITSLLAETPHLSVHVPDYADGIAHSLRAAFTAVPQEWQAALICLGDMPYIATKTLISLASLAREEAIIVPTHLGQRGNPVVWGRKFFGELALLTGDAGGKQLFERHSERIVLFATDDHTILQDVDIQSDFLEPLA